jgi:hypothetical protein
MVFTVQLLHVISCLYLFHICLEKFRNKLCGLLWRSFECLEINVCDSKSARETISPLKVIKQTPGEVRLHIYAVLDSQLYIFQVALVVVYAERIIESLFFGKGRFIWN